jgi:aspartate aminotransferase
MATRLNEVRAMLRAALNERKVKDPALAAAAEGSSLDPNEPWQHIVKQRGMFSYTGIPASVVKVLKEEHHVYMLTDGRISLAGLNVGNIPRFADLLKTLLGTQE